jgi:hypothetical protein
MLRCLWAPCRSTHLYRFSSNQGTNEVNIWRNIPTNDVLCRDSCLNQLVILEIERSCSQGGHWNVTRQERVDLNFRAVTISEVLVEAFPIVGVLLDLYKVLSDCSTIVIGSNPWYSNLSARMVNSWCWHLLRCLACLDWNHLRPRAESPLVPSSNSEVVDNTRLRSGCNELSLGVWCS